MTSVWQQEHRVAGHTTVSTEAVERQTLVLSGHSPFSLFIQSGEPRLQDGAISTTSH